MSKGLGGGVVVVGGGGITFVRHQGFPDASDDRERALLGLILGVGFLLSSGHFFCHFPFFPLLPLVH